MDNQKLRDAVQSAYHDLDRICETRSIRTGIGKYATVHEVHERRQARALRTLEFVLQELSIRISDAQSQKAKAEKAAKSPTKGGK